MFSENKSFCKKYQVSEKIGSGGFSQVVRAVDNESGNEVALKIFLSKKVNDKELEKNFAREYGVLKELSHPNIIRLEGDGMRVDASKRGQKSCMLKILPLEFCEHGDFFDVICDTGRFQEKYARALFHKLVDAYECINSAGFAHRDLKLENILVDGNLDLKIADFGFATRTSGDDGKGRCYSIKGTTQYMAPELIGKIPYNPVAVDIFALGVILFIMMNYNPPFTQASPTFSKHFAWLHNKDYASFWAYHEKNDKSYSRKFKDLLQKMFKSDFEERITLQQIKAHPWYNGEVASDEEIKLEFARRYEQMAQKN